MAESLQKTEKQRLVSEKSCTKHIQKPLNYYCSECKKIVCATCFVESHKLHDCNDMPSMVEKLRDKIEKKAKKIPNYVNEMLLMRDDIEKKKADFLKEIAEQEQKIHERNKELKHTLDQLTVDRHTKSPLDELSVMKSKHLKEMESAMEEIDRCCTIFKSFEFYCTELRSKGSASEICSSVDELIARADDLEREHEAFIGRPHKSVEISFQVPNVLQNSSINFVGKVEETTSQYKNFAVIAGYNEAETVTKDVIKINLLQPYEIKTQEQIPTKMAPEAIAAVYNNTMYVAGIGDNYSEIWKYNQTSGWLICASLVQGRRGQSAAFIDEVLYICGGFVVSNKLVLDSVEAYNAITCSNQCTTVGKLAHSVHQSGNCVSFKNSLFIFGGKDKHNKTLRNVQVYNTKENTCTLVLEPMPHPFSLMRAALWRTSVILVGCHSCFVFNIETGTWHERAQFKTGVVNFGLVLESGRLFVIGGGSWEYDEDGCGEWKYRDDVRYVPLQNILDDKLIEWNVQRKLPRPSLVHACANVRFSV